MLGTMAKSKHTSVAPKKKVPASFRRLICSLSKEKPKYVRNIIKKAKRPLIEALSESSLAVLRRTIKMSKEQARRLKKYEGTMSKLEGANTLKKKKQLLMKGGFVSALLGIAAPFVIDLLGKVFRRR